MPFYNPTADLFIPDDADEAAALSRTTHLCIGAHQDDIEVIAYHGIAACFGRADRWMTGVVVTNGAGSPRAGLYEKTTDEEMRAIRRREQRKAAFVAEYAAQIQLDYASSQVKDPSVANIVTDLFHILQATRPQVVYLHNPADKHDTHVAVLLRAIEALRKLPEKDLPEKVYGCEAWRDLDWLPDEDKIALPVSDHPNIAASLVGIFDSQISGGKRYDLATAGRRVAHATFHSSHATDTETALVFAVDLTPVVRDKNMSLADYTARFIQKFQQDVAGRFEKLQ